VGGRREGCPLALTCGVSEIERGGDRERENRTARPYSGGEFVEDDAKVRRNGASRDGLHQLFDHLVDLRLVLLVLEEREQRTCLERERESQISNSMK
jgi:hypothetical protein